MGLRRLTLFAAAYAAGTSLLLFALPRLVEEALSGETGAALLLLTGTAAVLAGARTAVSVLLAHLWRLCAAAGLSAGPVRAAALRLAPRAVRTALTAAVGGSLAVAVLAGPTLAASPSPAWPLTPGPTGDTAQPNEGAAPVSQHPEEETAKQRDPAWPLSESTAEHPRTGSDAADASDATGTSGNPGGSGAPIHVVEPGDSLWRIAAAELPGAEAPVIAARVSEVHAENRSRIGADANLILPGQRLVLP